MNKADTQRDAKRGEKLAPSSCKEASNDDEIVLQFANQIVDQRILFRQHCKSSVYKLFREFDEMADQVIINCYKHKQEMGHNYFFIGAYLNFY